ncbi:MAG TPA: MFS transporter, partial [Acidimicrobiia bacterium]|nr:MFS transporter [Acidimicrobiia bacterium]
PNQGWTSPEVVGAFTIGAVFLVAFAAWERHTPRPMLDLRIFKNPRFSAASATITLTQFAMFGSTFLLTQYFQFRLGYSPLESGIMLMPVAIGLMVASPNAPRLVYRFGTTRVVVIGLLAVGASTACYTSDVLMSSFVLGFLIRLVYGVGMGVTMAPVTDSIMGALPPARAGVGSAINDTTRQTGGALGVAVLGSIFAFRYHNAIATTVGVSQKVLHKAHDSIGVSLDVAHSVGGATGARLVAAAQEAFVSSMRVTFAVAAVVIVFAACVAARFLPPRAIDVVHDVSEDDIVQSLVVGVETAT